MSGSGSDLATTGDVIGIASFGHNRWYWRLLPSEVRRWLRARFGDVDATVKRGYSVWLAVGVVIAVPEIWAAVAKPPWPTISGTVGHLETRWNVVAIIVVAVIVVVAVHAVRIPFPAVRKQGPDGRDVAEQVDVGNVLTQADGRKLGRTAGGRLTRNPDVDKELPTLVYFVGALVGVISGSLLATSLSDNKWILGYVIYGLIAISCVIIPAALAYGPTPDAPFSGLFPTIADLQRRLHIVGIVILAGLVVLLIHLAFYPWPDVFRHHPGTGST